MATTVIENFCIKMIRNIFYLPGLSFCKNYLTELSTCYNQVVIGVDINTADGSWMTFQTTNCVKNLAGF